MRHSDAPSTRADQISSSGIENMNCCIRKMPNASTNDGYQPPKVVQQPQLHEDQVPGIIVTCAGIIIVASTN